MMKRLIEVALPLKEVSEQSAREKSIRHGHISTLHIWWARRPLAACRAAVFASLIPDPDDPACPESFRTLVMEVLGRAEFRPKALEPSPAAPPTDELAPLDDTPRNRCLEYIKHLVRWENSNAAEYIEPARTLIAAAHKILHPGAEGESPKVIDPFSGGGAIPLEALRLGCDTTALDLNPVAHLIELCTLVYPQKYGQPGSRSVPQYITSCVRRNKPKKRGKAEPGLFDHEVGDGGPVASIQPDVEISEAEYGRNPLAADVKYWGHWLLEVAKREVGQFYPADQDGSVPIAYLWARGVKSPSPTTPFVTPLLRHTWLTKKSKSNVAFSISADATTGTCHFPVARDGRINFDPDEGTVRQGRAICSFSQATIPNSYLQSEGKAGRLSEVLTAVVLASPQGGRKYRSPTAEDLRVVEDAARSLEQVRSKTKFGKYSPVPDEKIPPTEIRRISVPLYGLDTFGKLHTARQLNTLVALATAVRRAADELRQHHEPEYALAITEYLGLIFDRILDRSSTACIWHTSRETVEGTVGRHTLPMTWDFAETNPISGGSGNAEGAIEWVVKSIETTSLSSKRPASVLQGIAQQLPVSGVDAVITDPPYYDSVPYSHLADYFYVWLKRILGDRLPGLFGTPLCPKGPEVVQDRPHKLSDSKKTKAYFEQEMTKALTAAQRAVLPHGVVVVVYAHKTTAAWETLVQALLRAELAVTASWPLHTEMTGGMVKVGKAVLASSIFLVCRKRDAQAGDGLWDEVRTQLQAVARERLDFFWSQGIRGADFFISAIGPALSVFGRFERVTRLSGEEVTVGQFLDEVRGIVSNYALSKILKTSHTSDIDSESRFYVVWKWSYADAKVPADEAFKLAQALGMSTDLMWDRTGVLEKAGENVAAVTVEKRKKIKDLGEPGPNGVPASLIDALHRLCAYREKNDTNGMAEFLARSGQAQNPSLWLVAQAVSEILPDGDKEKQLMQGLLNQKDQLGEAQGRLF